MKIHEYQAKDILNVFNVNVPRGIPAFSKDEALEAANMMGYPCVIKAQIHAGGRGKGGGVKVAQSAADAQQIIDKIFGQPLITKQKDDHTPEPKKRRGRPLKSKIPPTPPAPIKEEKSEIRSCQRPDCEFFDVTFKGNCLMGPVSEGECQSYALADPIREVPKIESSVIVGNILQLPLDRDPELVSWVSNLSRPKLLMLLTHIRNLTYDHMELDRFLGQDEGAVQKERAA